MNKENPRFEIKYQTVEQQVLATGNTVSIDNHQIIEKHQREESNVIPLMPSKKTKLNIPENDLNKTSDVSHNDGCREIDIKKYKKKLILIWTTQKSGDLQLENALYNFGIRCKHEQPLR